MILLTESQFQKLCDDLYRDRGHIYLFNPSMPRVEVLLWTLLGSLYSLLDLRPEEVSLLNVVGHVKKTEGTSATIYSSIERYITAICHILDQRRIGNYDPRAILNRLIAKVQLD